MLLNLLTDDYQGNDNLSQMQDPGVSGTIEKNAFSIPKIIYNTFLVSFSNPMLLIWGPSNG